MVQIQMMKWLVDVDVERTKEFYKKDLELCHCLYCENYMEASKYLERSIIEVFTTLGIPPSKPSHLSEFGEQEDGLRLYNGSYHVVGKLVAGEHCTDTDWNETNTAKIGNFTYGFDQQLMFVPNGFPYPVLQLTFEARIPWVLSEKPED